MGGLKRPWLFGGACAGLALIAWAVARAWHPHAPLPDTPIYAQYVAQIQAGHVPYRDFSFVYPPLALPVFLLPGLLAGTAFHAYDSAFNLIMAPIAAAATGTGAYLLARQARKKVRLLIGLGLGGLAPLLLGPVMMSRYDPWPALLMALAVGLILFGPERVGFGVLALAVGAKAYPLAALPVLTLYVWRTRDSRRALGCVAVFAAVLACVFVPFAILSPHGMWASIRLQSSRPLQIESLGASLLLVAHQVAGVHLTAAVFDGSANLVGGTAASLAGSSGGLQIAVIILITLEFLHHPATRERVLLASAATVCAFIALDRVLSPQYLIWLVPMVVALPRARGVMASVLLGASMVLTQLWFPTHYFQLLAFNPLQSWLVFSRDILLLALLGTLAWPLAEAPGPAPELNIEAPGFDPGTSPGRAGARSLRRAPQGR